jgi:hypothetical protein
MRSLLVFVNRNSICAADDVESHLKQFTVYETDTLGSFTKRILDSGYIPKGNFSWIIRSVQVLGVFNGNWDKPRYLLNENLPIIECPAAQGLDFIYAYGDPNTIFDRLQKHEPIPAPYGYENFFSGVPDTAEQGAAANP